VTAYGAIARPAIVNGRFLERAMSVPDRLPQLTTGRYLEI
jgi:hypothetical protein